MIPSLMACILVAMSRGDERIGIESAASSLQAYARTLSTTIAGIAATNISGATFHPVSRTLYIVDDKDSAVYEISTSGALIRRIRLTGFSDVEDISYVDGNRFFIVEERRGSVAAITLPEPGPGSVAYDPAAVFTIGSGWENNGLEGVSYCEASDNVFAVKEKKPPRLYRISLDSNGFMEKAYANEPFSIETMQGDAAAVCALADGNFLLLNEQKKIVIGFSAAGQKLSELPLDMEQPEGIAFDPKERTIFIVGEPAELQAFRASGGAGRK